MGGLEKIFLSHGIRLRRSRNCFEARAVLREPGSPSVVMTDVALPDGDWTDVLRAASIVPARTSVIVVSRLLDIRLYLDVLDGGEHDFMVPHVPLQSLGTSFGLQSGRTWRSPQVARLAVNQGNSSTAKRDRQASAPGGDVAYKGQEKGKEIRDAQVSRAGLNGKSINSDRLTRHVDLRPHGYMPCSNSPPQVLFKLF